MKEESHNKTQRVRKVQKISGGQREEAHGVVHHVQGEHNQSSLDHYKDANLPNHTLGLTLSIPGLV